MPRHLRVFSVALWSVCRALLCVCRALLIVHLVWGVNGGCADSHTLLPQPRRGLQSCCCHRHLHIIWMCIGLFWMYVGFFWMRTLNDRGRGIHSKTVWTYTLYFRWCGAHSKEPCIHLKEPCMHTQWCVMLRQGVWISVCILHTLYTLYTLYAHTHAMRLVYYTHLTRGDLIAGCANLCKYSTCTHTNRLFFFRR